VSHRAAASTSWQRARARTSPCPPPATTITCKFSQPGSHRHRSVPGRHWQGLRPGRSGGPARRTTSRNLVKIPRVCDALTWGGKPIGTSRHYELMSIDDWGTDHEHYSLRSRGIPAPSNLVTGATSEPSSHLRHPVAAAPTDHFRRITDTLRCLARRGFSRNATTPPAVHQRGDYLRRRAGACVAVGRGGTVERRTSCSTALQRIPPSAAVDVLDALVAEAFSDLRRPTYQELHSVVEFPPRAPASSPSLVATKHKKEGDRDEIAATAPYLLWPIGGNRTRVCS